MCRHTPTYVNVYFYPLCTETLPYYIQCAGLSFSPPRCLTAISPHLYKQLILFWPHNIFLCRYRKRILSQISTFSLSTVLYGTYPRTLRFFGFLILPMASIYVTVLFGSHLCSYTYPRLFIDHTPSARRPHSVHS